MEIDITQGPTQVLVKANEMIARQREEIASLKSQLTALTARAEAAERERDESRRRLLSAAGDDLCRLSQDEIKAMTSGAVQIPPKEEFLASCERFHAQVAKESGVLDGCLTLAQLVAENESLRSERDSALNACPCRYGSPCGDNCTCANPAMSGGCRRCCAYGSAEQRAERAKELIQVERERDEARVELVRLSKIERLLDQCGHGLHRHYADNPIEAFQNRRELAKRVCDAIGVSHPEAAKAAEKAIANAPGGVSGSALIGLVRWYESALREAKERESRLTAERDEAIALREAADVRVKELDRELHSQKRLKEAHGKMIEGVWKDHERQFAAIERERDEARQAARWAYESMGPGSRKIAAAILPEHLSRWPWLQDMERPE